METVTFPVIRMHVQRNKVHTRANIALFERLHKIRSVDLKPLKIQTQHIQMPGMLAIITYHRQLQFWSRGKCRAKLLGNSLAPLPHPVGLGQLGQPQP